LPGATGARVEAYIPTYRLSSPATSSGGLVEPARTRTVRVERGAGARRVGEPTTGRRPLPVPRTSPRPHRNGQKRWLNLLGAHPLERSVRPDPRDTADTLSIGPGLRRCIEVGRLPVRTNDDTQIAYTQGDTQTDRYTQSWTPFRASRRSGRTHPFGGGIRTVGCLRPRGRAAAGGTRSRIGAQTPRNQCLGALDRSGSAGPNRLERPGSGHGSPLGGATLDSGALG